MFSMQRNVFGRTSCLNAITVFDKMITFSTNKQVVVLSQVGKQKKINSNNQARQLVVHLTNREIVIQ